MKELDLDKIEKDESTGERIITRKNKKTGAYEKEYISEEELRKRILDNLQD